MPDSKSLFGADRVEKLARRGVETFEKALRRNLANLNQDGRMPFTEKEPRLNSEEAVREAMALVQSPEIEDEYGNQTSG